MAMHSALIRAFRAVFARRSLYKWNRLLHQCSLRGLGVLNYESMKVSGEAAFLSALSRGKSSFLVFDVGANVGDYSRTVLGANPRALVHAFEPHPKTFHELAGKIEDPRFTAVNCALGEVAGQFALFDYQGNDGSAHASLIPGAIEEVHGATSIKRMIEVITLDSYATSAQVTTIDLLKIDTEGNELSVLRGGRKLIERGGVKAIQFEFTQLNVLSRIFFKDFWELLSAYTIYRMLPDGLVEIREYDATACEIFAYQNFVAVLREGSAVRGAAPDGQVGR